MKMMVTGAAGFIGMHCTERLLARGDNVVGVDNLNDYYEVSLKENRLKRISDHPQFSTIWYPWRTVRRWPRSSPRKSRTVSFISPPRPGSVIRLKIRTPMSMRSGRVHEYA